MDPVLERVCPVSFSLISFDFSHFISVLHSRSEFCSNQKALEERNHKCVQRYIEKSAPAGLRHRLEFNYEHIEKNLSMIMKHVI